jgi:tetratricopeptide (TPR) repeat protein
VQRPGSAQSTAEAERLYKSGNYCEAAPLFERAGADGLYAAVESWSRCVETKPHISLPVSSPPVDLPAPWERFIAAIDAYRIRAPHSPDDAKLLFNRAQVFYQWNHFQEAGESFRDLLDLNPENELAKYSAMFLLDCLSARKRYDELEAASVRYCALPLMRGDADATSFCELVLVGCARKRLEEEEHRGNWSSAARGYVKLADEHPDYKRFTELLFNAAVCFDKAGDRARANDIRRRLIQAAPKDPLAHAAEQQLSDLLRTQ